MRLGSPALLPHQHSCRGVNLSGKSQLHSLSRRSLILRAGVPNAVRRPAPVRPSNSRPRDVRACSSYGPQGTRGYTGGSVPLSPTSMLASDPRRRELPRLLSSARTWKDLYDLISRYEDVLLPSEVMQIISDAPRTAPPPVTPPPTARIATPHRLGSRSGLNQMAAAQRAWEEQQAARTKAAAAARAARLEQEQRERELYESMMKRMAERARRQLPDISNSRVLGDTVHALAHAGALDPGFAAELLERASQEASTGSLTLADFSDLMSALGSSGYRPTPNTMQPLLRSLDPMSRAGSTADLPALLSGLARMGYAPEDSFIDRAIAQMQAQQAQQLQQQREEAAKRRELEERQRQQLALLQEERALKQLQQLQQQQRQQQQQAAQHAAQQAALQRQQQQEAAAQQQHLQQQQQQQAQQAALPAELSEQVQQVAAAIRALNLMGRPQAAERLRRNFLAQVQQMQAEDAARQQQERQQRQQQQRERVQHEAQAAAQAREQEQKRREEEEQEAARARQQQEEEYKEREAQAVRAAVSVVPTWRHLSALLASHPEHFGPPELCQMLHRVPGLLTGSRLTWRERAELADFLEGAGALLIQQLDQLQEQRQRSGKATGTQPELVVAPDDCLHALEALLALRYLSTPLMAVLLRETRAALPLFQPHHFERCLSALATAGVRPSLSWMTALVEASLPKLQGCSLDQLSTMAASFCALELNPGSEWMLAYLEAMHSKQGQGNINASLAAADALDHPLVTEWLSKLLKEGRSVAGQRQLPTGGQPPVDQVLEKGQAPSKDARAQEVVPAQSPKELKQQEEEEGAGVEPRLNAGAAPASESIEFDEEAALEAEAAARAAGYTAQGHPMHRVPESFLRDQMAQALDAQSKEEASIEANTPAPAPAPAAPAAEQQQQQQQQPQQQSAGVDAQESEQQSEAHAALVRKHEEERRMREAEAARVKEAQAQKYEEEKRKREAEAARVKEEHAQRAREEEEERQRVVRVQKQREEEERKRREVEAARAKEELAQRVREEEEERQSIARAQKQREEEEVERQREIEAQKQREAEEAARIKAAQAQREQEERDAAMEKAVRAQKQREEEEAARVRALQEKKRREQEEVAQWQEEKRKLREAEAARAAGGEGSQVQSTEAGGQEQRGDSKSQQQQQQQQQQKGREQRGGSQQAQQAQQQQQQQRTQQQEREQERKMRAAAEEAAQQVQKREAEAAEQRAQKAAQQEAEAAQAEAAAQRADVWRRKAKPPPRTTSERASRFFDRLASQATMPAQTRALYQELKEKVAQFEAVKQEAEKEEIEAFRRAENTSLQLSAVRSQIEKQQADYDRFRQRHQEQMKAAGIEVRLQVYNKMLPLLDNFERARETLKVETQGERSIQEAYEKGVAEPIREQLRAWGVEEISETGVQFDPMVHEAVMLDENPNVPENTVTTVFRKGYKYGDKLLRPALVKVSAS